MKYVNVADLPSKTGPLRRAVADEPLALTDDGKPFAVVVKLEECEDPAELERYIRQARFQYLVSRARSEARKNGTDMLTMEEIDAEIRASRAENSRWES